MITAARRDGVALDLIRPVRRRHLRSYSLIGTTCMGARGPHAARGNAQGIAQPQQQGDTQRT